MGHIPNCEDACWQCKNTAYTVSLNRPIKLAGVRRAMIDLMIHRSPQVDQLKLDPTGLVKTMTTYTDGNGKPFTEIVFGERTMSQNEALCRSLVLRLFAARVLVPALDNQRLYAKLVIDETGTPIINHDSSFEGFTLIA
jgi:hypothetical protein